VTNNVNKDSIFVKQAPEFVAVFGPDGFPLTSARMQQEMDGKEEEDFCCCCCCYVCLSACLPFIALGLLQKRFIIWYSVKHLMMV
jgi:hypothetical protein